MKYYIFYLKKEYVEDVVGAEYDDDCLYAYTDNKEVYKRFKMERDITKFKISKIDASKEDIAYLARNHQNRILRKRKVYTTKNHYEGIETVLAVTDDEYQNVQNDISFRMCNINSFKMNPLVLKDNVLYSLCKFGVMKFSSYILPFSNNPEWSERKCLFERMSDRINFEPDFLKYFISLYKDILKGS